MNNGVDRDSEVLTALTEIQIELTEIVFDSRSEIGLTEITEIDRVTSESGLVADSRGLTEITEIEKRI